jgi:glucokinase
MWFLTAPEPVDRMADSWLLGIEIGGTKLQLGIGRGDGTLVALERLRVDPSQAAAGIRAQIQAAFPPLLQSANLAKDQIKAVGIGFGGPVDAAQGRTQKSYQIADWDDFPLSTFMREHLGVPLVVLENDADAAGLAEARFGAGLGYSPLLYMNVGSGIGGALILDDRIYRGSGQGAAEIGHLRVPDVLAETAQVVELEQVASGWAIASTAQKLARRMMSVGNDDWAVLMKAHGDPNGIHAALVAEAASHGDPIAASILDRARTAVAYALTEAITLLAPRRVVLGGGVSLIGEKHWVEPIRLLIDRDVFQPFRGRFDIVPATLGEEVVVHGALALARDAYSNSAKLVP